MECATCTDVQSDQPPIVQECCGVAVCKACLRSLKQGSSDGSAIVEAASNYGCPLCHTRTRARTRLHDSAMEGNHRKIRKLLQKGARVNKKDERGWTPLHFAVKGGHSKCVKILLRGFANPSAADDGGWTPLLEACWGDHLEILLQLLESATIKIDKQDKDGWTALHAAAYKGHADCVLALIESGARINLHDGGGQTPGMLATQGHYTDLAILLNQGATMQLAMTPTASPSDATAFHGSSFSQRAPIAAKFDETCDRAITPPSEPEGGGRDKATSGSLPLATGLEPELPPHDYTLHEDPSDSARHHTDTIGAHLARVSSAVHDPSTSSSSRPRRPRQAVAAPCAPVTAWDAAALPLPAVARMEDIDADIEEKCARYEQMLAAEREKGTKGKGKGKWFGFSGPKDGSKEDESVYSSPQDDDIEAGSSPQASESGSSVWGAPPAPDGTYYERRHVDSIEDPASSEGEAVSEGEAEYWAAAQNRKPRRKHRGSDASIGSAASSVDLEEGRKFTAQEVSAERRRLADEYLEVALYLYNQLCGRLQKTAALHQEATSSATELPGSMIRQPASLVPKRIRTPEDIEMDVMTEKAALSDVAELTQSTLQEALTYAQEAGCFGGQRYLDASAALDSISEGKDAIFNLSQLDHDGDDVLGFGGL